MLKELIRDRLINAAENGYNYLGQGDREIAEDIVLYPAHNPDRTS